MTYKEKFMADHADMPSEEAEGLMLSTCPDIWLYQKQQFCPVTSNLMLDCADCWEREIGGSKNEENR